MNFTLLKRVSRRILLVLALTSSFTLLGSATSTGGCCNDCAIVANECWNQGGGDECCTAYMECISGCEGICPWC